MAIIKPFQCIRPKKGLEEKIAALPYDVYNRAEAKAEVLREPMSFLRIDRAETCFDDDVDIYDQRVYQKAHDILWEMVEKGEFVKEDKPCYYVYELTMNGRSQTGIAACASIDDYNNQTIKKHENTRADKEADRIKHVDSCNAQTGPIFLAYRTNSAVNGIVEKTKKGTALYDFLSPDGIRHAVWIIDNLEDIDAIQNAFASIKQIYIADGHHRCASAAKVSMKRRAEKPSYDGIEEFNYFLSVLFPDNQLMIMDYNRVVKDLNGYTTEEFLEEVSKKFNVEAVGTKSYKPEQKGFFGMYLDGCWYRMSLKNAAKNYHPVEKLDVSILQNELLTKILGIGDLKTDKRIDFVGGIRGLEELEKRVAADCKVAFAMYPTSIQELFEVSDEGLLMPPKSTWFEPKLRSGLFIHEI